MRRIVPSSLAALLTLTAASGALIACGDAGLGGDEQPRGNVGSIGLELVLGAGVRLNSIQYEISGNGYSRVGAIDVSDSSEISAIIGGIPAGSGYTIRLWADEGLNGGTSCEGSASFEIEAGATTSAVVALRCQLASGSGSVAVRGEVNVCPVVRALSAEPAQATVGGVITLSAEALDLDGQPAATSFVWAASGGLLTPSGSSAELECTANEPVAVTVSVSDGDCEGSASLSVTCSEGGGEEQPVPAVRINEIESSGGTPGDWVELYNGDDVAADLSGWAILDNDDGHAYALPAGTVLAPGAFLVLDETALDYGLGGGDSVRLLDATGELVDSYTWASHAATTYGRCPDGAGEFADQTTVTKGGPNDCGTVEPEPETLPWPGTAEIEAVDPANTYTSNLSGLVYQPAMDGEPAVLWAGLNGPGTLYRLLWSGERWVSDSAGDWSAGKALRYPDGAGNPDTEGVTKAAWNEPFVYTATERNNDQSTVSRLSVLRFDASAAGTELVATHEWNVTADLPAVGANLGLEAITFVPDALLVAGGFRDDNAGAAYEPSAYPNHGGGLFFVGVEGTGFIHAYALDHSSAAFVRIASVESGHPGVMGLELDRETGQLWAICDDTCGNRASVLTLDSQGRFVVRGTFERPATLPDVNNEGFAIAPESECSGGDKPVFWSDDNNTAGQALRRGSVPCGSLF